MAVETATGRRYEVVIGLEIHAELLTESKIFCACSTAFGGEPNSRVCPICLGLPGTLPVLNERAVELAVKAGLALGCHIALTSKFDRKNYFYPDLPKAYQVSQYDQPLCRGGFLEFEVGGERKRVGIARIHLEEEAGKLVHSGDSIIGSEYSLVDYNRCGIPLIEIVTEPDLRSPEEARVFLETLRTVLQYTGVSDCKMEEGSLRCDANISLRPAGSSELGTKTEVKNMNSFRAVQRALEYEVQRQLALLEDGEPIIRETRAWDEARGVTVAMRSKEEAHDYRYFPEPDLVPVVLTSGQVERWRAELPEMPDARRRRFAASEGPGAYGLPEYDAGVLTADKALADYFEDVVRAYAGPENGAGRTDTKGLQARAKTVSNWVMGEFLRLLNEESLSVEEGRRRLAPEAFARMLRLIDDGTISGKVAKEEVFEDMFRTGRDPEAIVEAKGLRQISDAGELERIVQEVIAAHPAAAEEVRSGKDKAIGFLVGQVMRLTKGQANPQLVNEVLRRALRG